MIKKKVDAAVIGAGPAGLAAAISAKKEGIDNLLIIERDEFLGGILNQCIHEGFGLERSIPSDGSQEGRRGADPI